MTGYESGRTDCGCDEHGGGLPLKPCFDNNLSTVKINLAYQNGWRNSCHQKH